MMRMEEMVRDKVGREELDRVAEFCKEAIKEILHRYAKRILVYTRSNR
jgi:L-lysine 2,3-aminomutase